jgi:hypothetical protein
MTETTPPPPPGPPVYVARAPTNGMAVAALVLGIVGCVGLWLIGPILALVFGYVSKGQIDRSGGAQEGRGFAVAGIVLGWVGIGLSILVGFWFWFLFTQVFPDFADFPEQFPRNFPSIAPIEP